MKRTKNRTEWGLCTINGVYWSLFARCLAVSVYLFIIRRCSTFDCAFKVFFICFQFTLRSQKKWNGKDQNFVAEKRGSRTPFGRQHGKLALPKRENDSRTFFSQNALFMASRQKPTLHISSKLRRKRTMDKQINTTKYGKVANAKRDLVFSLRMVSNSCCIAFA